MITIGQIQNQSSSDWTFEDVHYKGDTVKYLRVSWTGEQYRVINFGEAISPEIETRLLSIAEAFHKAGVWSVTNVTAA